MNADKSSDIFGNTPWYHVCDRCDAKWFAGQQRMACPRCRRRSCAIDRLVPPWLRSRPGAESNGARPTADALVLRDENRTVEGDHVAIELGGMRPR